ncbi:MAG: hypothetical protein AAB395_03600 [Patescibacteria group bacterium]
METSTNPIGDLKNQVLQKLQGEHDPDTPVEYAQQLIELTGTLDNDQLLGLCCEIKVSIRKNKVDQELEPNAKRVLKISNLEMTIAKLHLLIDLMPTIDRTRAINLYKRALDPELEYHFQAGGYVSKCLDSLGVGADTAPAWRNALDSNDPEIANNAIAMFEDVQQKHCLEDEDIPAEILEAYRLAKSKR